MEIQIFDVAHGFCAYVIADNGNTMLIDCGYNAETGFYPSNYLRGKCKGIQSLFVLNYDEDHLGGLPSLRQTLPIELLYRNTSTTADQLRAIKRKTCPTLGHGLLSLLDMIGTYTGTVSTRPEYPDIEFNWFNNNYPSFSDTNNLSLVLFLHCPGFSIVFPGDLERAGWHQLLQRGDFQENLRRTNIFVASHHGRESGYAEEVFDFCTPGVVIISDESIQYETQKHCYDDHAKGIVWNQSETRKVLTTRNDGMLTITPNSRGSCHIQASR
jgi:beta-lactamase superfamily II metal-dependent hydrolase